jgi:hypothetical protein
MNSGKLFNSSEQIWQCDSSEVLAVRVESYE